MSKTGGGVGTNQYKIRGTSQARKPGAAGSAESSVALTELAESAEVTPDDLWGITPEVETPDFYAHPDADKLLTVDADERLVAETVRTGILSSEVAQAMGHTEYGGPGTVLARKEDYKSETDRRSWINQNAYKPMALDRFTSSRGLATRRAGLMASKEHPHLLADVDAFTSDGGTVSVRCYRSGSTDAGTWRKGELPVEQYWSAQQDMAVTGKDRAYAVGFHTDTGETHIIEVARDEQAIATLIDETSQLWSRHLDGTAPEPEEREDRWFDRLPRGETKQLGTKQVAKTMKDIQRLYECDSLISRYRHQRDEAQARILAHMGSAERLVTDSGETLASYTQRATKNGVAKPTLTSLSEYDASLVKHYTTEAEGNSTVVDADRLVNDHPAIAWKAVRRTFEVEPVRAPEPIPGVKPFSRGSGDRKKPGQELGDRRCPNARLVLPADVDHNDPRWHAERTKGIGGSDAAKLMGDSPYGGIATVYDDKTDQTPVKFTGNHVTEVGHRIEPLIADDFEEKTGISTRRAGTMAAKDRDHFRANVDRLTADGGVLEIKSFRSYSKVRDDWESGSIPKSAWWQLQHCMAVTGRQHGYGIGKNVEIGQTFIVEVARDEEAIGRLTERVDYLEDCRRRGVRPQPDAADLAVQTKHAAKAKPGSARTVDAATAQTVKGLADTYRTAEEHLDELTGERDQIKKQLKELTGTAEEVRDSEGRRLISNRPQRAIGSTTLKALDKAEGTALESSYTTKEKVARRTLDAERLKAERPDVYHAAIPRSFKIA